MIIIVITLCSYCDLNYYTKCFEGNLLNMAYVFMCMSLCVWEVREKIIIIIIIIIPVLKNREWKINK